MSASIVGNINSKVPGITILAVTGLWLFLLFTNGGLWFPVMLVGYLVVVPVITLLAADSTTDAALSSAQPRANSGQDRAVEILRDRYARGELTDEQFERKLERLLEVETIEDIDDWEGDRPESSARIPLEERY